MGSYTNFESMLEQHNSDKINEMYFSGDLDKMYDDYEEQRKGSLNFRLNRKSGVGESWDTLVVQ